MLRVLPQFLAGIFFTYLYVRFGLLATVLMHFASNAILFALHKSQRVGLVDLSILAYSGFIAVVSYQLMTKPVGDVLVWFNLEPQFSLPGFGIM